MLVGTSSLVFATDRSISVINAFTLIRAVVNHYLDMVNNSNLETKIKLWGGQQNVQEKSAVYSRLA